MQEHQHNKQLFTALLSDNVPEFSSILYSSHHARFKDSTFSPYELLCEAIRFGRRRVAYYLLDQGCRVSEPGSARLPLHSAIERLSQGCGWTNIVLKLLYAGARVSDVNANGDTALHLGFARGVQDHVLDFLMKVYLEESDGVDAVNAEGLSVLHIACTRPKVDFVRELLENQADVNRWVPWRLNAKFVGYTPLHIAVDCGNHEVANLLLEYGAHIYKQNLNGSTPLHLACYCRDTRMIDLILTHDRVTANVVDNDGLSHFMVACTSSEPAFAKEHLRVAECRPWTSAKALIGSSTKNVVDCQFAGYTPLHFAAEFGSSAVLDLLLARGARCCAMTGWLFTPLMLAEKHGHEHVARVFKCYCEAYQGYRDTVLGDKGVAVDERVRETDGNALICKATEKPVPVEKNICESDGGDKSIEIRTISSVAAVDESAKNADKVASIRKATEKLVSVGKNVCNKDGDTKSVEVCVNSGVVVIGKSLKKADKDASIRKATEKPVPVCKNVCQKEGGVKSVEVCVNGSVAIDESFKKTDEDASIRKATKKPVPVEKNVCNKGGDAKSSEFCVISGVYSLRKFNTDSPRVSTRKRTSKTLCSLVCCSPNVASAKKSRKKASIDQTKVPITMLRNPL